MRLFHKAVGPEGPVDPHSIPAVPDVSTAAPEAAAGATPAELTAENVLLSAVVDSSKALTSCAELLAKAVGGIAQTSSMLEGVREDPAVLPGPTSRVNYFNSVAKASQASQAAHIKNLQWDWISAPGNKIHSRIQSKVSVVGRKRARRPTLQHVGQCCGDQQRCWESCRSPGRASAVQRERRLRD